MSTDAGVSPTSPVWDPPRRKGPASSAQMQSNDLRVGVMTASVSRMGKLQELSYIWFISLFSRDTQSHGNALATDQIPSAQG